MKTLPREFLNFLQESRKIGKFCDTKIYVDPGIPGQGPTFQGPIFGHSLVLSYISPFFDLCLSNLSDANKGELTIRGVTSSAVEHILNYFYTGRLDEIPIESNNVLEINQAAKKLEIPEVQNLCDKYLRKAMNPYGRNRKLVDLTFDHVINNISTISKTGAFLLLDFQVIHSILSRGMENDTYHSQDLMKSAAAWLSFDSFNRKQYFVDLLDVFSSTIPNDTLYNIFIEETVDHSKLQFLGGWTKYLMKTIDRGSGEQGQMAASGQSQLPVGIIHPVSISDPQSRNSHQGALLPIDQRAHNSSITHKEPRSRVKREMDPDSIHPCMVCNQPFDTIPKLRRHLSTHPGQKPWPCDECGRLFRHQPEVYQHKKYHHVATGSYKCSQCPCVFQSEKLFNRHCRSHDTDHDDSDMSNPGQGSSTQNSFQSQGQSLFQNQNPGLFQQAHSQSTFQKQLQGHFLNQNTGSFANQSSSSSPTQFQSHNGGGHIPQYQSTGQFTSHGSSQFNNNNNNQGGTSQYHGETSGGGGQYNQTNSSNRQGQTGENPMGNVELVWGQSIVSCHLCHRTFSNSFVRDGHMRTSHVEGGLFPCNLCPCKFDSPRGLSTHRGIYHNLNRKNLHKLTVNKGESSSSGVESPGEHHSNNQSHNNGLNTHMGYKQDSAMPLALSMQQQKPKNPRGRKKKKEEDVPVTPSTTANTTPAPAPAFRGMQMDIPFDTGYERMRVDGMRVAEQAHLPIGVYARSRNFMDFAIPDF